MAQRTKRGPQRGAVRESKTEPADGQPTPYRPNPPRKNLPLLLASVTLFGLWLVILVVLAVYRW